MRVDVLTIFPDYLSPLRLSLVGKAIEAGLINLGVHDLRGYTHDRHRTVDDTPYGGGAGMVMRPEPWGEALDDLVPVGTVGPPDPCEETSDGGASTGDAAGGQVPRMIVPSPSGLPFTQAYARELSTEPWLLFGCGRYEGLDQRVLEHARTRMRVDEISLGDYVLAGGEVAVLVIVEAVARLLPGVLGNPDSLVEESHAEGLLEYPVYTKPTSWRGLDVPEVLLSGHHGEIARWRREESLRRTEERRPDLLG